MPFDAHYIAFQNLTQAIWMVKRLGAELEDAFNWVFLLFCGGEPIKCLLHCCQCSLIPSFISSRSRLIYEWWVDAIPNGPKLHQRVKSKLCSFCTHTIAPRAFLKNGIKGFYRRHENAMYCEVHFISHNYRDAVHYNYADFAERHNGSLNPLHGATMGA